MVFQTLIHSFLSTCTQTPFRLPFIPFCIHTHINNNIKMERCINFFLISKGIPDLSKKWLLFILFMCTDRKASGRVVLAAGRPSLMFHNLFDGRSRFSPHHAISRLFKIRGNPCWIWILVFQIGIAFGLKKLLMKSQQIFVEPKLCSLSHFSH